MTPEHEPAGPVLAVDLDGTLVCVNTFPHFVKHLLWGLVRAGRWVSAVQVVLAVIARKAFKRSHQSLKARVCEVECRLPVDGREDFARRMLDRHGNSAVLGLVREWEGRRVLTTSAPEGYATVIGSMCAFDAVHGSAFRAGALVENVGARKVQRLDDAGCFPPAVAVTDDDTADLPLLMAATRGYVAKGDSLKPFDASARPGR